MSKEITVPLEEELKLRRAFEFGAYLLIMHYLTRTYGLSELRKFAKFWAERASKGERILLTSLNKNSLFERLKWKGYG